MRAAAPSISHIYFVEHFEFYPDCRDCEFMAGAPPDDDADADEDAVDQQSCAIYNSDIAAAVDIYDIFPTINII